MPILKIAGAIGQGALSGVWPVASIVVAAIFLYKVTVKIKFFDVIKTSITSISKDKRIQVLLIAFSFGAFLEGAAGFGTPVAITASILVGLGFKPVYAATICLIANIAGGAYGAMGIPVTVPANLTDINPLTLGQATSVILSLISLLVAFIIVFIVDGFKGIKEVLPAILVSGGSFALTQFLLLNFVGLELVDLCSAIVSIVALFILLKFWTPKNVLEMEKKLDEKEVTYSSKQMLKAWSPFIMLTIFVTFLNTALRITDDMIDKVSPVVDKTTPIKAIFTFNPFTSTTTAILLAAILTIVFFKVRMRIVKSALKETLLELYGPVLTICSVLAFANIATYSGMSSTLGLAFAATGKVFPLFSPILGWIGVFLTGSVINSGSLFAGLQAVTTSQIGIAPEILVASNIMEGAIAKMISPQSIAAAAVGLLNQDSKIFSKTIKWSIIILVLVGVANYLLA